MTPEEQQRVISQYQQWLADAQLTTAQLSATLASSQSTISAQTQIIDDLREALGRSSTPPNPGPKPGPLPERNS